MDPSKKDPAALEGRDRELAACQRAFESAGTIRALQDAVMICAEQCRPLPSWLTIGLLKTLDTIAAPVQRDQVDYVRYLAVCEGKSLGLSWNRAYEYAQAYLMPIDAAKGGWETMRAAYKRVRRGKLETPDRYFLARGDSMDLTYQPSPEHAEAVLREYLK